MEMVGGKEFAYYRGVCGKELLQKELTFRFSKP